MERCRDKFIKWTLGLYWNIPSYIIREEIKRQLLRIEIGKRAVSFEDKIREKSDNNILKEYFREIEKNREAQNRRDIDRNAFSKRWNVRYRN